MFPVCSGQKKEGEAIIGRRGPGLMNQVLSYIMWMAVCMYVAYLGNTWHQDALWEEGKPAETV